MSEKPSFDKVQRSTKWGLVADKLTPLLARTDLSEDEHDTIAAAINYLDECDGAHMHAHSAPSATVRKPSIVPIVKALQEQRDECADALRTLARVVESHFPMPAGVWPHSPLDVARKALAKVPTYEQRLRNIAEGVGMTYEELTAGVEASSRYVGESKS